MLRIVKRSKKVISVKPFHDFSLSLNRTTEIASFCVQRRISKKKTSQCQPSERITLKVFFMGKPPRRTNTSILIIYIKRSGRFTFPPSRKWFTKVIFNFCVFLMLPNILLYAKMCFLLLKGRSCFYIFKNFEMYIQKTFQILNDYV